MPKEITHWLIAEEVITGLEDTSRLKKIISGCKNLYLLGAVLPDSLLYMKFGKDAAAILKRANEIHNAADTFYFLKKYIDEYDGDLPDAEVALLSGIITHFCADSVFHPFTYFFGGKDAAKHFTLEVYTDLYFKEKNTPKHKWLFKNILKSVEINMDQLIEAVYKTFFKHKNIDKKSIIKMLGQHSFMQSQFDRLPSRIILHCINLLPGIDVNKYLALFYPATKPEPGTFFNKKYDYQHPVTGEHLVSGLDELKEKTVENVVSLFNSLSSKGKLHKEALKSLRVNANTGLAGKTSKDMRYFSDEMDVFKTIF